MTLHIGKIVGLSLFNSFKTMLNLYCLSKWSWFLSVVFIFPFSSLASPVWKFILFPICNSVNSTFVWRFSLLCKKFLTLSSNQQDVSHFQGCRTSFSTSLLISLECSKLFLILLMLIASQDFLLFNMHPTGLTSAVVITLGHCLFLHIQSWPRIVASLGWEGNLMYTFHSMGSKAMILYWAYPVRRLHVNEPFLHGEKYMCGLEKFLVALPLSSVNSHPKQFICQY